MLRARLILELHGPTDAVKELEELIKERDEIACQAHLLLARIYLESDPGDPKTTKQYQQKAKGHQQKGEKLFSESADAYCLRAMTAGTLQETLDLLNKAIELDRSHYTSLKVRALAYYALRDYRNMERDAVFMTALRDRDSLGYSLMAIALRETDYFADALKYHNKAIKISPDNPQLYDQRRQTYMQMGNYEQALSDAQECVQLQPNENIYHFHVFFSLAALGRYDDAKAKYATIAEADPKAKIQFDRWAMREMFNILGAGQRLDLPEHKTGGVAFWPLHEAANYYRELSAKGERLVTRGFRAAWSPDGTELAYSRGFPGANGIEILHLESRKTRLLTIPGKDPVWSPDGTYIAFVRERQVQNLAEITGESDVKAEDDSQEEIWIIKPNSEELRRLANGGFPTWSNDSRR
ncbi:PD40 domain-containing protein, partial [bacterium]|nr:PD40 domain-containing protein [bacterium]